MTRGKGIVPWVISAGILVLLYLLSSTDLIIKEKPRQVYQISLIVGDTRDDYYVNFRRGVDRAAIEMQADVSFITMYQAQDSRQQMDLIIREQQDGAEALIIAPIREAEIAQALADGQIHGPVITINSTIIDNRVAACVSPDFYSMGRQLAEKIIAEQNPKIPVYLLSGKTTSEVSGRFYEGVRAVFEEHGIWHEWLLKTRTTETRDQIEKIMSERRQGIVLIALDQETLAEIAGFLSENRGQGSYVTGVYGRGNTLPALNYLDKEVIKGVCVTDDFSAGYMSVKAAVDTISNKNNQGMIRLDSYYIKKEDLFSPEYEKMLFPVE